MRSEQAVNSDMPGAPGAGSGGGVRGRAAATQAAAVIEAAPGPFTPGTQWGLAAGTLRQPAPFVKPRRPKNSASRHQLSAVFHTLTDSCSPHAQLVPSPQRGGGPGECPCLGPLPPNAGEGQGNALALVRSPQRGGGLGRGGPPLAAHTSFKPRHGWLLREWASSAFGGLVADPFPCCGRNAHCCAPPAQIRRRGR